MIEATNICVQRGKTHIINHITLQAKSGALTVIIGPNGSGKSTFIKALSGEISYSGKITLNGYDVTQTKACKMATMRAILPQSTALAFPFLVHEVVRLGLSISQPGVTKTEFQNLPQQALEQVGLADYGDRYYHQLSGGEQARVQFARVLCQIWNPIYNQIPRWLILDEPIANLDVQHQLIVMNIAKNFAYRGGGVLAILHDLNLAAHYADKIILFKQGKIYCEGSVFHVLTTKNLRDVYHCPLSVSKLPKADIPFVLPQTASHW
ncbi:hemin import ATP-binding protein HmuV [Bartonella bacilliformis Peru38]|uniref:Hemin ABC transporter, ATP-binding protein n=2 Tax=Bartonella bacilliformis TaxID=774 RepID=A1US19_BARBK|nr:heme ABC transporter ATP-binding protein [Bartonella bacilliformis]ABM44455.1 hemin ABC transporter, ATP-binding protein [Bartonella bacilliformis KC583]AMG85608.1 heme ABC transporter ATP-binding protein [Bartonella bacilliformis]EKS45021.1 hemin importer ATP-binding subunit [Bartonella bacilliformis INS]EYS90099.1 hemin import ATP-binding protein HmuV [Bartonella bacilliformis San Pedro600-02]EYS94998.1 hemin import ATP-binding protein HmuV [Bartonella bacilliformis Peru-18]